MFAKSSFRSTRYSIVGLRAIRLNIFGLRAIRLNIVGLRATRLNIVGLRAIRLNIHGLQLLDSSFLGFHSCSKVFNFAQQRVLWKWSCECLFTTKLKVNNLLKYYLNHK